MSKRVSNSKTKRNGKLHARQTVRLGWRKKRAKQIIAEFKRQQWINEQVQGGAA
jgi:hypothetical protein